MVKTYSEIITSDYTSSDEEHHPNPLPQKPPPTTRGIGISIAGSICFIILMTSLLLNFILLDQKTHIDVHSYSGLLHDTQVAYRSFTDYGCANDTLSDELWESLSTDSSNIAVSKKWAKEHGLANSVPFPWDDDRMLYIVKGYHQIHCLKAIRRALITAQRGQIPTTIKWSHIHHCLDMLRQDIMCIADDTPMPIPEHSQLIGDGQVMQCRDWKRLTAWTQAPERNACYRQLSDYTPVVHRLERFAFCPEGSRYEGVAGEYFRKHGHRNAFHE